MERKIYNKLYEWKCSPHRKPLILQGARQIGKTYIVNLFGNNEYTNVVYCNFEQDVYLESLFSTLNIDELVTKLSHYTKKEIIKNHTLIIFDEIQACPKALTSLKYFAETHNEYHIIALGSLLGVAVNRENYSFPVGKVDILTMYCMDFEEFLHAKNEQFLIGEIKNCFNNKTELATAFHEKALMLYKEYLVIGGMPEVVRDFIETNDYNLAKEKQNNILSAYKNDMSKYNKNTVIAKTAQLYANIGVQLAKENKKFQYSKIKSGARANEYSDAIQWLCLSGIAHQHFRLEQVLLPFSAYKSQEDFKLFMSDVGLCCASLNINYEDIIFENKLLDTFKGGLVENYVLNQLVSNNLESFYWTSGNQAEVDAIIRLNGKIVPIEIKSGYNSRARSLTLFTAKFKPDFSIRISKKNFGFENNIFSVPLYAVFCIK